MIYLFTFLTICIFALAIKINSYWKSMLFNSFVLSVILLVAILLFAKIPYDDYMVGNAPLNNLLSVGVVALAIPFYEQLPQIRRQWRAILFITTSASLLSMLSGALVALLFQASPEMVATILPKSVTTPIAMEISANIGGVPAITAVCVVPAGLQGSMFGYLILKKLNIKHKESIGLSVGAISHALGTASVMAIDQKAGSYSSLSLVLCGVLSSLLAPAVFSIVHSLM